MASKAIYIRYVFFITTIILSIVINQSIIQYDIDLQNEDALSVDYASKQQMLSQRIAKLSLYIKGDLQEKQVVAKFRLDTLQKLVGEFEKIHHALLYGDKSLGLGKQRNSDIRDLLIQKKPIYNSIVKACKAILAKPQIEVINQSVEVIESYELKYLYAMEKIVDVMLKNYQTKIKRLKLIELILSLLTILILFLELGFIFHPLIKRLNETNNFLKHSNQSLKDLSQHLKSIFDSTAVAIIATDTKGMITHFNKGAEEMLQYKAEEVINQRTPEAIHIEKEIKAQAVKLSHEFQKEIQGFEVFAAYPSQGKVYAQQWTYRRKDGTTLPVHLVVSAIKDSDEQIKGFLGVATDISERVVIRKALEQAYHSLELLVDELTQQNKQLLNFTHVISHNLRSPVSNLKVLLDFYQETTDEQEKELYFSKIEIVSQHLADSLNELMEALKIREDVNKQREQVSFAKVFKKIEETFIGQILESKAIVQTDFSKLPNIQYSKSYLESILLNFFSNALKYRSPERVPLICLETDCQDGKEILTISDNGLGINLAKHGNKLFGMNKTFHEHPEAKGVGLFITKTQVEAMGGKIFVSSEVNEGSAFKIVFNELLANEVND